MKKRIAFPLFLRRAAALPLFFCGFFADAGDLPRRSSPPRFCRAFAPGGKGEGKTPGKRDLPQNREKNGENRRSPPAFSLLSCRFFTEKGPLPRKKRRFFPESFSF
jgi:hypothetical protein